MHASTRMTPFWALYHRNPQMQCKAPKPPASHLKSEIQPDAVLEGLEETHRVLRENLLEPQKRQSKYAGGKEITFNVGDKVWLSTKHLRTTRPSKKLDYKRTGPYTVSKIINKNAYKLDLPNTMRNHNVFHISLLDWYASPVAGQPRSEPQPMIVDDAGEEEWEVERMLDAKLHYRKLHYLVQWAGYSHVRTSWAPADNLENAQELVDDFHRTHPEKPRRKWIEFRDSEAAEMNWVSGLGGGGNGLSFGTQERRKGINWTISFASPCFTSFSYWSGPVQMTLALVLPPSDQSQVEVEFPRAPDAQNYRAICFILCFHPCMKICSPGGQHIERGMM